MRITNELSRFPGLPQPVHSMDTGGSGGGDSFDDDLDGSIFDQGANDDGGGGDDDNFGFDEGDDLVDPDGLNLDDSGDGEGITDDASAIFKKLFAKPKAKVDAAGNPIADDGNGGDNEPTQEQVQTQLASELDAGIKGLTLPDIPDDFDANDRTKLKNLLISVQQTTARNAINLMFQPVQVALGRTITQMRKEMRATANDSTQNSAAEQMLRANVPAASSEEFRPMVDFVFTQAKKRFPNNLTAQVKMTKQTMAIIGIRSGSRAPRGSRPNSNGAINGKQALDVFAPLPTKPQSQNRRPGQGGQGNMMMRQLARMMSQGGGNQR